MHDTIPWQLGLIFFVVMVFVFGLEMGSIFGCPLSGIVWVFSVLGFIAACGLTYDRIKYGRWFSR